MPFKFTRNKGKTFVVDPDYKRTREVDGETIVLEDCPTVFVKPRDPDVWMRDNAIKMAKLEDGSQNGVNHIIDVYAKNLETMKSNIRLTVGRQRF